MSACGETVGPEVTAQAVELLDEFAVDSQSYACVHSAAIRAQQACCVRRGRSVGRARLAACCASVRPEVAARAVEPLAEIAVLAGCVRGGLELVARDMELLSEVAGP